VGRSPGCACTIFSCWTRAASNAVARSCLIFGHPGQQPFHQKLWLRIIRGFVAPPWIVAQRDERSFGRSLDRVQPARKRTRCRGAGDGTRPLAEDCIDCLVERPGVPFRRRNLLHDWPAFRRCRGTIAKPDRRHDRLGSSAPIVRNLPRSVARVKISCAGSNSAARSRLCKTFLLLAAPPQNVAG